MKAERGLGISVENLLRTQYQLQIWGRELSRRDPLWKRRHLEPGTSPSPAMTQAWEKAQRQGTAGGAPLSFCPCCLFSLMTSSLFIRLCAPPPRRVGGSRSVWFY